MIASAEIIVPQAGQGISDSPPAADSGADAGAAFATGFAAAAATGAAGAAARGADDEPAGTG